MLGATEINVKCNVMYLLHLFFQTVDINVPFALYFQRKPDIVCFGSHLLDKRYK